MEEKDEETYDCGVGTFEESAGKTEANASVGASDEVGGVRHNLDADLVDMKNV